MFGRGGIVLVVPRRSSLLLLDKLSLVVALLLLCCLQGDAEDLNAQVCRNLNADGRAVKQQVAQRQDHCYPQYIILINKAIEVLI